MNCKPRRVHFSTALARGPFSTDEIAAGTRIACRIEYDGGGYCGWQAQSATNAPSVQCTLERALAAVAGVPLRVHCAGRTDAGVHAHAQIIHFDAPVARSPKAWVVGGNANLSADIRIHWAAGVVDDFHARHAAQYRRYRYLIANTAVRPALLRGRVAWHRRALDAQRMDGAAQGITGERDFSAFRAAGCQSRSPMRNVHAASVRRAGDFLCFDIRANAFLHHMVRNLAGALLAIGDGRRESAWLMELLHGRDRTQGAETAPACGLYLVDVGYPRQYALPGIPMGPAYPSLDD